MIDALKKLIPNAKIDEEHAERMGYDCGKNGPNETNCHFSLFSLPELTRAWERGKARAQRDGDNDADRK